MSLLYLIALAAQTSPAGGDFGFEDVPYLILALLVGGGIIFLSTTRWNRMGREARERRRPPAPAASPAPIVQQRQGSLSQDDQAVVPPPHPQELTSAKRRHMIIIGAPGDGKTQAQIALMVGDIRRGDQVVWASTNLALYHSRDQHTDLRPITHLFEHTREPLEIMAVLLWASAEVDRRMPFYHDDLPHGDPVVIYVDELGGLYRQFGDLLVAAMRNIAEQGRKVDVYLGLVAHNALKESTGLDMALKPLFQTRLLGNVDQATWTAMVGPGIKLRSVPDGQGLWHMPDRRNQVHEIQIRRPTAGAIQDMARRKPDPAWTPILAQATPYLERLRALAARATKPAEVLAAAIEAPATSWAPSELHLQVRELVDAARPEITCMISEEGLTLTKAQELTGTSNRALARRLGLGQNGGSAAVKVGELIKEWEEQGGVRLFDVPTVHQDSRSGRSERPERPERPERLERDERVQAA